MEKDREAFEAHIRRLLPYAKFDRDEDGGYIAVMLNARWMGWQAALAYARGEREALPRDEGRFRRFYPEPRAAIPPDAEGELLPPNMVRKEGAPPYPSDGGLKSQERAIADTLSAHTVLHKALNVSPPEKD